MQHYLLYINIICCKSVPTFMKVTFPTQLEESEAEYKDLLLCNDVRWFSHEQCSEKFQSLLPEIIQFWELLGEKTSKMHDASLLIKLAF